MHALRRMTRERFSEVFKHGEVRHSPHLLIRVSNSQDNYSHGAVVVSKRVEKGAVQRHLLKRRLYSILAHYFRNSLKSHDIVIVIKKNAGKLLFRDLKHELMQAFEG